METCRYCKGTGKVTLLTSESSCECPAGKLLGSIESCVQTVNEGQATGIAAAVSDAARNALLDAAPTYPGFAPLVMGDLPNLVDAMPNTLTYDAESPVTLDIRPSIDDLPDFMLKLSDLIYHTSGAFAFMSRGSFYQLVSEAYCKVLRTEVRSVVRSVVADMQRCSMYEMHHERDGYYQVGEGLRTTERILKLSVVVPIDPVEHRQT